MDVVDRVRLEKYQLYKLRDDLKILEVDRNNSKLELILTMFNGFMFMGMVGCLDRSKLYRILSLVIGIFFFRYGVVSFEKFKKSNSNFWECMNELNELEEIIGLRDKVLKEYIIKRGELQKQRFGYSVYDKSILFSDEVILKLIMDEMDQKIAKQFLDEKVMVKKRKRI